MPSRTAPESGRTARWSPSSGTSATSPAPSSSRSCGTPSSRTTSSTSSAPTRPPPSATPASATSARSAPCTPRSSRPRATPPARPAADATIAEYSQVFLPVPEAVAAVRRFVTEVLTHWRELDLVTDAALVASELAHQRRTARVVALPRLRRPVGRRHLHRHPGLHLRPCRAAGSRPPRRQRPRHGHRRGALTPLGLRLPADRQGRVGRADHDQHRRLTSSGTGRPVLDTKSPDRSCGRGSSR